MSENLKTISNRFNLLRQDKLSVQTIIKKAQLKHFVNSVHSGKLKLEENEISLLDMMVDYIMDCEIYDDKFIESEVSEWHDEGYISLEESLEILVAYKK